VNNAIAAIALAILLTMPVAAMAADDIPKTPDAAALRQLLETFLANVDQAETHDRFWAEDLVYTSSNGTRRGKAEIMAGFKNAGDTAGDGADAPVVTYGAEDIRIREYGDTATVAFRLVADTAATAGTPPGHSEYFNTGTFAKRDGRWQVVAWQATRIPDEAAGVTD